MRQSPHDKRAKIVSPFVANCYAATAIITKHFTQTSVFAVFVDFVATPNHPTPNPTETRIAFAKLTELIFVPMNKRHGVFASAVRTLVLIALSKQLVI